MRQLMYVFKVERTSPAIDPLAGWPQTKTVRRDVSTLYPGEAEGDYLAHLRNAAVVKGQQFSPIMV